MHSIDALSIEGTSSYGVLCYGIFPSAELESAHHNMLSLEGRSTFKIYKLMDEQWPNGLLLVEVRVSEGTQVPGAILSTLSKMFEVGPCLCSVCMFEGVFSSYEDIFSATIADQTYAFCFQKNQPVFALDSVFLASKEWKAVIVGCRERLG